jgi:Asp-tRNA(Asn)/Glu-tRNA(Gln) amidotransferase A subunit family amidase
MGVVVLAAVSAAQPDSPLDRDLLDVTVPKLQQLYADKKYTVTQVVQWHIDRIDRYNGVYAAIETLFRRDAPADAGALRDKEAPPGQRAAHCGAFRSSSGEHVD